MDVERLERLSDRVGGRFRLTSLLQKRLAELVRGSPPLVDLPSNNFLEIALQEIEEGRIELLDVPEEEEAEQLESGETEEE